MQNHSLEFLGRHIELWTHSEPDHLAVTIGRSRTWYELDVLMKCRELYLPGTTILDVGANIGNHSVFFGAILNAPVHAFEPYGPNHDLLELNIAANRLLGQVTAHCCAIGEHPGVGTMRLGLSNNLGTVRFLVGDGDVPIRSLDSFAIPGPIGILKIDVEGAEVAVLRGAELLIRTWLPDIVVEAAHLSEFAAVAERLLDNGYVPCGRYAWTPTYLFSAVDQATRIQRILHAQSASRELRAPP